MKIAKKFLKSNNGFTLQDAVVAAMLFTIFIGVIASIYLTIYRIQGETIINSRVNIFMIQIMERIDLISYEEANENYLNSQLNVEWKEEFEIPNDLSITAQVIPSEYEFDVIKTVKLNFSYMVGDKVQNISVEKLKVKET